MGTLVEMQPWLGFEVQGTDSDGGDIPQPTEFWLDLKEAEEVALSISVLDRWPATGVRLLIQTAVVAEGPWTNLATFGDVSLVTTDSKVFLTSKAYGEEFRKFERYLRWMVKTDYLSTTMWGACFKIDAIVR